LHDVQPQAQGGLEAALFGGKARLCGKLFLGVGEDFSSTIEGPLLMELVAGVAGRLDIFGRFLERLEAGFCSGQEGKIELFGLGEEAVAGGLFQAPGLEFSEGESCRPFLGRTLGGFGETGG
jgi:hypothetical protein